MTKTVDIKYCDICGVEDTGGIASGFFSTGFHSLRDTDLCNMCYNHVSSVIVKKASKEIVDESIDEIKKDAKFMSFGDVKINVSKIDFGKFFNIGKD